MRADGIDKLWRQDRTYVGVLFNFKAQAKVMEKVKIKMTETFPSFLLSALALIAIFTIACLISKLSFLGVIL